jgi:integrase
MVQGERADAAPDAPRPRPAVHLDKPTQSARRPRAGARVRPLEDERRNWGTGSIYPTVKGWRVAVRYGRSADGRYLRKEWQFRDEAAAWAKIAELEQRAGRGLPAEQRIVTLAAYADEWLMAVKPSIKPTTYSFYESLSRNHLTDLRHLQLRQITPTDLRRLIAKRLAEGYAPRTVNGVVDVVRMILHQAEGDGLVDRNVAELVARPKADPREPRHYSSEQAWQFLDAIAGDSLHSLFVTAFGTGLRRSELLALTWRDVDLDAGVLLVRKSKTAAGVRAIPLASFVADELRMLERKPGPLWRVTPWHVSARFPVLTKRVGLPPIHFHEIRHSTASILADAGVDWELIQQILGHTRMRQTAHYARVDIEVKRAAMEKIGRRAG